MKSEVLRTFLKTTKKKYSMNNVLNFREKLIIQTLNFICSVKKYLTLLTIFKEGAFNLNKKLRLDKPV